MSARPIGDFIAPILERCEHMRLLHVWLRATQCNACQKRFIMDMRDSGSITDEETRLLIDAYGLETA